MSGCGINRAMTERFADDGRSWPQLKISYSIPLLSSSFAESRRDTRGLVVIVIVVRNDSLIARRAMAASNVYTCRAHITAKINNFDTLVMAVSANSYSRPRFSLDGAAAAACVARTPPLHGRFH